MAPMPSISRLLETGVGSATVGKSQTAGDKEASATKTASSDTKSVPAPQLPAEKPHTVEAHVKESTIAPYQDETFSTWRNFVNALNLRNEHTRLAEYLIQNAKPVSIQEKSFNIEVRKNGLYAPEEVLADLKKATHVNEDEADDTLAYKWHLGKNSKYPTLQEVEQHEGELRKNEALSRRDVKQILETFPGASVVKVTSS